MDIKNHRIELNFCKNFLTSNGFNEIGDFFEIKKLKLKLNFNSEDILIHDLCGQDYVLPLNRYALIGFLFHFHIISIDYKYPNEIKNSI